MEGEPVGQRGMGGWYENTQEVTENTGMPFLAEDRCLTRVMCVTAQGQIPLRKRMTQFKVSY